jgi:hypothetical protein
LPELLAPGAEAYGFRGEVWTCARIAILIEEEFGVSDDKAHVSRLLREVEWTPQKPITRDARRNELEIARFRAEVWPALKKRPGVSAGPLPAWTKPLFTCWPEWSGPTPRVVRRRC